MKHSYYLLSIAALLTVSSAQAQRFYPRNIRTIAQLNHLAPPGASTSVTDTIKLAEGRRAIVGNTTLPSGDSNGYLLIVDSQDKRVAASVIDFAAHDTAISVRTDSNDNLFVEVQSDDGMHLTKYDSNAAETWTQSDPGFFATCLVVDAGGNPIVLGSEDSQAKAERFDGAGTGLLDELVILDQSPSSIQVGAIDGAGVIHVAGNLDLDGAQDTFLGSIAADFQTSVYQPYAVNSLFREMVIDPMTGVAISVGSALDPSSPGSSNAVVALEKSDGVNYSSIFSASISTLSSRDLASTGASTMQSVSLNQLGEVAMLMNVDTEPGPTWSWVRVVTVDASGSSLRLHGLWNDFVKPESSYSNLIGCDVEWNLPNNELNLIAATDAPSIGPEGSYRPYDLLTWQRNGTRSNNQPLGGVYMVPVGFLGTMAAPHSLIADGNSISFYAPTQSLSAAAFGAFRKDGPADYYSIREDSDVTIPANHGLLANDPNGWTTGRRVLITDYDNNALNVLGASADGSLRIVPRADYHGVTSFTCSVYEGGVIVDTYISQIEVRNVPDAPKPKDDSYVVDINSGFTTLDVLSNDVHPDGLTFKISGNTAALHGTVTISPDRMTLQYKPNTDYSGKDTFTYTVKDSTGRKGTATVNIRVK